jgi:hypothetical protein
MNFNEMVQACWEAAKLSDPTAYLLVAESPAGIKIVKAVFHGAQNSSIIVSCNQEGDTRVQRVNTPYMDCLPIRVPVPISQEESLTYLYDAKHSDEWKSVTFRKPLGPVPYNALYIYTYDDNRTGVVSYWAVDSTDGSVFQLF